jgi:hypothetical protein
MTRNLGGARVISFRGAVLLCLTVLVVFGLRKSTVVVVLRFDEQLLSVLPYHTVQGNQSRIEVPGQRNTPSGASEEHNDGSDAPPSLQGSERTLRSRYAYAFLVSGCDPASPVYRNMLAGVYVAVYLLRKYGSTQDAIVYFMMADSSEHRTLPVEELNVLYALNATPRQIPTSSNQTFHRVMLQKFRIFGLSQYRRVMFFDADAIPLLNPDYLFEISDARVHDPPTLKENLVFTDYGAPANGGTFMLKPGDEDMSLVNDLIKEAQTVRNQGVEGNEPWRRVVPDPWDAFDKRGASYDFHGVSGDQGLLWWWVRHYKRTFSYVLKDGSIQNYVPDGKEGVRVERRIARPFLPDREVWPTEVSVWGTNQSLSAGSMPHDGQLGAYANFFHYWRDGKPWIRDGCSSVWNKLKAPPNAAGIAHTERAKRFWCQTYYELSIKHNASIKVTSIRGAAKELWYHPSVSPEMWATPGPITNLLDPDIDPKTLLAGTQSPSL